MGNPSADPSAERQVLNLLHLYAERVDQGDFDGVAELFEHGDYARTESFPGLRGQAVAETMRAMVHTYEGGRPGTKHVVTNEILDIDEVAGRARARSYFTVLQAVSGLPLQPIVTGRYLDELESVGGRWRFAVRTIEIEQVGDVSHHLKEGRLP